MDFPAGSFGSAHLPAVLEFMARFRPSPGGGVEAVPPVGKPPAGHNVVGLDRYHLASRTGGRRPENDADTYTLRPIAIYQGGTPTTLPAAVGGGLMAVNVHPNPADGALASSNPMQEYGGGTIYDGKLPPMPLYRAMPYGRIPPKLPGVSTGPAALAASGFIDPYAAAGVKSGAPSGPGLVRWTP